jgi:aminomethyltransferase
MATESPLHQVHKDLGALFTDFAGWSMPVRYSSELAEHKAVREAAGIFDLSHMAEIEITGRQAADVLDYALVGNLSAVKVGRARYSMLCDATGGILDDLVVYRLEDEKFLVVANAGNAAVVADALAERVAGFDAVVTNRSAEVALIAVQGPRATDIVGAVTDADLPELKYYASVPANVKGPLSEKHSVLLARTGYTGEDGFELYVPASEAPAVWQILTEAGEPHDLLPAGLACRDTLRLEAGMPLYGNELSVELSPFQAGLGRVVKFEKPGDFVGKAALTKRAETDEARVLVGLRGVGRRAPRHGYQLLAEVSEGHHEGPRVPEGHLQGTLKVVGEVTSGALSPTLGYPVAMAYLAPELSEPGTKLSVDIRGKLEPVEVVALPFYKRAN